MKQIKGEFEKDELIIINLWDPENPETFEAEHGDTFAVVMCQGAQWLHAPDFDGTTSGSQSGINVLIPRRALPEWERRAREYGGSVETASTPVEAGYYGDGREVSPIELVESADGSTLYWIE